MNLNYSNLDYILQLFTPWLIDLLHLLFLLLFSLVLLWWVMSLDIVHEILEALSPILEAFSVIAYAILKGVAELLILVGSLLALLLVTVPFKTGRKLVVVIHEPPGATLLSIVDFLYSPRTVEHTFKPLISDWRLEYYEAIKAKRKWKARWICVRNYFVFAKVMGLDKVFSIISGLLGKSEKQAQRTDKDVGDKDS